MTAEDRTHRIIEELDKFAGENPDVADFYNLHKTLLQHQSEAKAEIFATLELADERVLKASTRRGQPLLSFSQLPIEAETFARLAAGLAAVLVGQDPDLEGQPLPDEAGEWLALAERRFGEGQVGALPTERKEEETEPDLAEMAADLALQPYLQWAADQLLPHIDQHRWKRNYCPVCGGPPDFAILEEEVGARHMVCSRCNSEWLFRRLGCAFCDNNDFSKLVYYPGEDGLYRLYVCEVCRRYLKAIDLRKAKRRVLLEVERISTVAMDVAARQEGYT